MKNFLVLQLARFGDLIQTKRLLRTLSLRGQVHLCVDSSLHGVARLLYPYAHIHPLPIQNLLSPQSQIHALYTSLCGLHTFDFTAVYILNHTRLSTALARLFAPEQVHGYAMHGNQPVHNPWIQKAFAWTQNRVTSPINLMDFWAYFDATPCPSADVNPIAQSKGDGLGVVLAGRESRRSLPPPLLATIVRTFFESTHAPKVYLLGTQTEMPLARQLKKYLPAPMLQHVEDMTGKTSWNALFDIVQGLSMLISPDTGTMHLAAHLGVPIHAFFLSSAFCHETGPYGTGHTVWQSVYECAPCLESAPCPIHTKCLEDFTHRDFLRSLALVAQGQKGIALSLPPTLTMQTSIQDSLGSTWECILGKDIYAQERQAKRAVLAAYCGTPLENVLLQAKNYTAFYSDADAMLHMPQSFL